MPSIVALYHYFQPDDVVSAVHFSELCAGLHEKGWEVTALPCNRGCHEPSKSYPARSNWLGVDIHRIWRPAWRQNQTSGRLASLLWMLLAWSVAAMRYKPDVLIVGTDPILSILVALPWKIIRPQTKIVHWCFDLYPEAAVAAGLLRRKSWITRVLEKAVGIAYGKCDVLVDIGACMAKQLARHRSASKALTLTPWALIEPPCALPVDGPNRPVEFDGARIGLLYSGTFGRAHAFERTLSLARKLRNSAAVFVFGIRGSSAASFRAALVDADDNIKLQSFVSHDQLQARLAAAHIHIVTLRDDWTGSVVPSKFFAALAAGRPVLFEGGADCAIAEWIRKFGVGWVLTPDSEDLVAAQLSLLSQDPARLVEMFDHCHRVYMAHFSKACIIDAWHRELTILCSNVPEDTARRRMVAQLESDQRRSQTASAGAIR